MNIEKIIAKNIVNHTGLVKIIKNMLDIQVSGRKFFLIFTTLKVYFKNLIIQLCIAYFITHKNNIYKQKTGSRKLYPPLQMIFFNSLYI